MLSRGEEGHPVAKGCTRVHGDLLLLAAVHAERQFKNFKIFFFPGGKKIEPSAILVTEG